jgi:iron complex outermembrane receptor protein
VNPFVLTLTAAAAALASGATLAQTAAADAGIETQVASLAAVVVTGSNRAHVKELGGVAPVDVITAEQLTASGAATALQALQKLAPTVNFPQGAATGTEAWNAKAVTLGGMNPNYTLVLIDGKRANPNAIVKTQAGYDQGAQAVDLDAIPVAAIARIEVLRDGASAQYGSDAIAGVVNIVLRRDSRGGQLSVQAGAYAGGEGQLYNANARIGTQLGRDGFATFSVGVTDGRAMSTGVADTRQYYFAGDPRESVVNRDVWGAAKPERRNVTLLANAETALGADARLYGVAGYADKTTTTALIPLRPMDDANVRAIFPNGAQTTSEQSASNYHVGGGVKLGDRDTGLLDISLTTGGNHSRRWAHNAINASLGLASPTEFYVGQFRNSSTEARADYTRDLPVGWAAEPLTLAVGAAYRQERWSEGAGDEAGYINGGVRIIDGPNAGNTAPAGYPPGNQPLRPSDAGTYKRRVAGVYATAEQTLAERWQLGAAARLEHYSDFGSNVSVQGSLRFDVTPDFALRGSLGTGYRAPSLGQTGLSQTTGQAPTGVGIITQGQVLPASSALAQRLGASDLKAEKSRSLTAGVVWRPVKQGAITLDVYRRELRDAIVYSGNISGPLVTGVFAAAGLPDTRIAQYFSNAVDYTTHGADLVSRYRLDLAGGELNLSASGHWHKISLDAVRNNTFLESAGLQIINRVARNNIEVGAPRSKAVLGADFSRKAWGVSFNVTRYGSFRFSHASNAANDQMIAATTIADLELRHKLTPALQLAVGAQNLFDARVDALNAGNRTVPYTPYAATPTDPFGRFAYARLSYNF